MEDQNSKLSNLRISVDAGRDRFDKDGYLNPQYVTDIVVPIFQDLLNDLCIEIDQRHKLDASEGTNTNFVIHYTSVATIVSMLQGCVKKREGQLSNDDRELVMEDLGTTLRLYDSAHLNDPDEGNYLIRNLNPQEKYEWLSESSVAHAYISSFIIPDPKKDMSDNLAFWRAYGRDGEGCSLRLHVPISRLRKVIYDPDEVRNTVLQLLPILQTLDPLVEVNEPKSRKDIRRRLADAFRKSLGKIQFLYKSEAYDYETECRFVIPRSDTEEKDIRFDYSVKGDSHGHLRHYYEHDDLEIENMSVSGSRVTLGPRVLRSDDVCRSIEVLRRRAGLEYRLQVRPSTIPPYRTT